MLGDEDFRDLIERSALIREMSDHPGWLLLNDRAKVNLFSRQRSLIQGQVKSMEDYVRQTAWMEGVSFILDLPAVVQNELERETAERKAYEEALKDVEDQEDWVLESAEQED